MPPFPTACDPVVRITIFPDATDPIAAVVPLYTVFSPFRSMNSSIHIVLFPSDSDELGTTDLSPCPILMSRRITNLSRLSRFLNVIDDEALTRISCSRAPAELLFCLSHTTSSLA